MSAGPAGLPPPPVLPSILVDNLNLIAAIAAGLALFYPLVRRSLALKPANEAWLYVGLGSMLQAVMTVKEPRLPILLPYFLLAWLPVTILLLRPWGLSFWMHQLRTQMGVLLFVQVLCLLWGYWHEMPINGVMTGIALLLLQVAAYDSWRSVVFNQVVRRKVRQVLSWFGLVPRRDPLYDMPGTTGAMGTGKKSAANERSLNPKQVELNTQIRSKERRAPADPPPFSELPPGKKK